jgi:hypothetical protein
MYLSKIYKTFLNLIKAQPRTLFYITFSESSHSNNVRSASNIYSYDIPCFPANNSTDAHHCDIVLSRSSPSHFTKDRVLLILPKSEPGQLQKN